MARTRSTSSRNTASQQSPQEPPIVDPKHEEPSPTFKASLQRFQYAVATTASPTKQPQSTLKRRSSITKTTNTTHHGNGTPPPGKKRRAPSKYAPPVKYAHLAPLTDTLAPNLICIFVGTNPGIRTATAGHAYAHPSNLFWKLLHASGCTERRCRPDEDGDLPRLYAMGNTNIVERATRDAGELSRAEMAAGAPVLEDKVRRYRPEAVCVVGKGIWEAVWRARYGRNPSKAEFRYGWQDERENMGRLVGGDGDGVESERAEPWDGARVFVASSTSGLSASTRPAEKEAIWKPFGEWVKARREQRKEQNQPG